MDDAISNTASGVDATLSARVDSAVNAISVVSQALSVVSQALSVVSAKLSTATEDSYTWVIANPVTGGIPGPKLRVGQTAKRITGGTLSTGTTVTYNIEKRVGLTAAGAGANLLSDDQVASLAGVDNTTMVASALTADSWLWVDISGTSGAPAALVITLAVTKP
jgi:hypothetical protein